MSGLRNTLLAPGSGAGLYGTYKDYKRVTGEGGVAPESPGGSQQYTGIDPSGATSGARRRVRTGSIKRALQKTHLGPQPGK